MKITHISRNRDLHKKRVAAYCRVSTLQEEQEESMETQLRYYTNYIAAHADWEFAGVYSDEKSGLSADNRRGFQQLIKDSLEGSVDFILVKSISRFSRNAVDCQRYVNLLHSNGVDVFFEKENINTADASSTMLMSFMSVFAQNESRSISENMRWAIKERVKKGEHNLGNNRVLGYDCVNGVLVPNKDAPIIRDIFEMYLSGAGLVTIREKLTGLGIMGKNGNPIRSCTLLYILKNEIYVGDRLLQKQAPKDFLTKRPDKRLHYESNYLYDDHEAIVSREVWDGVQKLMKDRRERNKHAGMSNGGGRAHFLYGKLFCGECGGLLRRKTYPDKVNGNYKVWLCRGRKAGCKMRAMREEDLIKLILEEGKRHHGAQGDIEQISRLIERIEVFTDRIEVSWKDSELGFDSFSTSVGSVGS